MKTVFQKPAGMRDKTTHYCPGCTHGISHRLIAEVLDSMEAREKAVCIEPVGCAVIADEYFNFDVIEAAHGRAPAVATAMKRLLPDNFVFTYQGDGDLASIGMGEIVHASGRGENICVFFINNAIYGMTGGQMAPTTLLGQVTTTSPYGRQPDQAGYPLKICEILAQNSGSAYICRTALNTPANVMMTKRAIRKAFETQNKKLGFSLVEILSTCPTNWGLSPVEAMDWVKEEMIPVFPLGEFKVREEL